MSGSDIGTFSLGDEADNRLQRRDFAANQVLYACVIKHNARHMFCSRAVSGEHAMHTVRLLGYRALPCGCVVGIYRERAPHREVVYIEEKSASCTLSNHRRNHTIPSDQVRSDSLKSASISLF
jgi:hypothetical protein